MKSSDIYEEKLLEIIADKLEIAPEDFVIFRLALRNFCDHVADKKLKNEKTNATYEDLVKMVEEKLLRYCIQDWWTEDSKNDARKIVEMVRSWEPKKL